MKNCRRQGWILENENLFAIEFREEAGVRREKAEELLVGKVIGRFRNSGRGGKLGLGRGRNRKSYGLGRRFCFAGVESRKDSDRDHRSDSEQDTVGFASPIREPELPHEQSYFARGVSGSVEVFGKYVPEKSLLAFFFSFHVRACG